MPAIAANRPPAVLMSASEIPMASLPASTAPVWPRAANERIIASTVPSSPPRALPLDALGLLVPRLGLGPDLLLGRPLGAELLVALEARTDDIGRRAAL